MKRLIIGSALALALTGVNAQQPPEATFAAALKGHVSAPLPDLPDTPKVIELLQKESGSKGPITAEFDLLYKFKSQPSCGRVQMLVVQRSTKTVWPKISAEMNICSNGMPPLRQCAGSAKLVSADIACPDGSSPIDTPEISESIAKAIAGGGLTAQQVKDMPKPYSTGTK